MPCSLSSICIFSDNEVSLSNTLAIVPLKLVIWFVSLSLRISILSCLTDRLSFSLTIYFLVSSLYSGLSQIAARLSFSHSMHCCNSTFFVISTFSKPLILLSCLSRPWSSRMGNTFCPSNCAIKSSMLLVAFSIISWSSMSPTLATSDAEGSSFSTLFFLASISTMTPTDLSFPL